MAALIRGKREKPLPITAAGSSAAESHSHFAAEAALQYNRGERRGSALS
jgi:hypothetical protein